MLRGLRLVLLVVAVKLLFVPHASIRASDLEPHRQLLVTAASVQSASHVPPARRWLARGLAAVAPQFDPALVEPRAAGPPSHAALLFWRAVALVEDLVLAASVRALLATLGASGGAADVCFVLAALHPGLFLAARWPALGRSLTLAALLVAATLVARRRSWLGGLALGLALNVAGAEMLPATVLVVMLLLAGGAPVLLGAAAMSAAAWISVGADVSTVASFWWRELEQQQQQQQPAANVWSLLALLGRSSGRGALLAGTVPASTAAVVVLLLSLPVVWRALALVQSAQPSAARLATLLRVTAVSVLIAYMFGPFADVRMLVAVAVALTLLGVRSPDFARASVVVNAIVAYTMLVLGPTQPQGLEYLAVCALAAAHTLLACVGYGELHGPAAALSWPEWIMVTALPLLEAWRTRNGAPPAVAAATCAVGLWYALVRLYLKFVLAAAPALPSSTVTATMDVEASRREHAKAHAETEAVLRQHVAASAQTEATVRERVAVHVDTEHHARSVTTATAEVELVHHTIVAPDDALQQLPPTRGKKGGKARPSVMDMFGLATVDSAVSQPPPPPQPSETLDVKETLKALARGPPGSLLDWGAAEDMNLAGLKRDKKVMTHGAGKKRFEMQDAHVCVVPFGAPGDDAALLAIFDGHAGKECALDCVERFPAALSAALPAQGLKSVADAAPHLVQAYATLDQALAHHEDQGATATTVLVWRRADGARILQCANVGDSTAFLCHVGGQAVALSVDHKVTLASERERVLAVPGVELAPKATRIPGGLAVSRALGDHFLKSQATGLIGVPSVSAPLVLGDEGAVFVVVASDGLWDVVDGQTANDTLAQRHHELDCSGLAAALVKAATSSRQCNDNVTVIVARV